MRRVTLTFDNGPTPGVTERVLEVLERAGLQCTFFVIGQKLVVPGGLALMEVAHGAGHWIGNHTLTHSVAFGDRPEREYAVREIEETQALMVGLARAEKLFRPYGNSGLLGPHLLSRAAVEHLLEQRYCTVGWNCVPGDWRDADGWVERCMEQVSGQEWAVVVLHDVAAGCLAGLAGLIGRLRDGGVVFEQGFPDSVVMTRAGEVVTLEPSYVVDGFGL